MITCRAAGRRGRYKRARSMLTWVPCTGIARRFNCCPRAIGSTAKFMSRLSSAELLQSMQAGESPSPQPRALLLAAHPDDETIGASAMLGRLVDCWVTYLTDGAPQDPQFRSPHISGSREMYALVRAEEAASALAIVGIPSSRISFLNAADQEAIFEVQRLIRDFTDHVQRVQPNVIITHPYEGGHPDHDAAALVARLAVSTLQRCGAQFPEVLEFTSYHASGGQRSSGDFLPPNIEQYDAPGGVRLTLSPEERSRKARMLGCYLSQWHVLSEFPLEPERLRTAPAYDFTKSPHAGPLWY